MGRAPKYKVQFKESFLNTEFDTKDDAKCAIENAEEIVKMFGGDIEGLLEVVEIE